MNTTNENTEQPSENPKSKDICSTDLLDNIEKVLEKWEHELNELTDKFKKLDDARRIIPENKEFELHYHEVATRLLTLQRCLIDINNAKIESLSNAIDKQ